MVKFLSRKFVVTILVMLLGVFVPVIYQKSGVSESLMLAVIALLSGVGVAYGVVNLKESKIDLLKSKEEEK